MNFDDKIRSYEMRGIEVPRRRLIKSPADIEGIKRSAEINIAVLDAVAKEIHIGMTTEEIDRMSKELF